MAKAESTLLLPVAALEDVVGRWRLRLDPAAADGILPHMTLNYPWLPPAAIDQRDLDGVAEIALAAEPFSVTFATSGWFGTEVIWLAPEPASPITMLAEQVLDRWPQCPLYGDASRSKNDIVPHVTVGYGDESVLLEAQRDVSRALPVIALIDELWLMQGVVGEPWSVRQRFPLGSA